jgi:sn-glycerol 3-phosphate transport system ATP-binding protein
MANISLRAVRKNYGKTEVIHGVNAEIADGELIVIVGPSGCGKSTLLRMVAGLETITAGEIAIGGRVVNKLEPRERDIAMVFQNYALYPHMSVFDNMAYGLKIARVPKSEIEERVGSAARLLELEPYLRRKPRQLSGGQRQRVAMGRAIVRKPSAFLFDEPLSNLDAKLRVQMRFEIKSLQTKLAVTALYVTHDQVEAMTLADRMIVMNAGVTEQIGAPLDVYARPATTFVAGFIGSPPMNFLPGHQLAKSGVADRLSGADPAVLVANGFTVGVRPEHLSSCAPDDGVFRGKVVMSEALGADTLVHLALDGGGSLIMRIDGELAAPASGDEVGALCAPDRFHVFDDAGKRVGD